MDHLPFEDWILNNEPLTPRQKQDLAAHLQECRTCTALREVDLALGNVRQAEPAPGFSARFQVRLAEQRQAMKRRNAIGFSLLAVAVLGGTAVYAFPILQAAAVSPLALAHHLAVLAGRLVGFPAGAVPGRLGPAAGGTRFRPPLYLGCSRPWSCQLEHSLDVFHVAICS